MTNVVPINPALMANALSMAQMELKDLRGRLEQLHGMHTQLGAVCQDFERQVEMLKEENTRLRSTLAATQQQQRAREKRIAVAGSHADDGQPDEAQEWRDYDEHC